MQIIDFKENLIEMDLFNLGQKYPNAKLLRVEINTWDNIYVIYTGKVSLKIISNKLGLENLTHKHIVKNS